MDGMEISKADTPMERVYHEMMKANPMRSIGYPYNFMQTLIRSESRSNGFAPTDVEAVEAAWHTRDDDDVLWEGGYVLRLRDGKRVYVESFSGRGDWADDAQVSIETLPAGQRYPELPQNHYQVMFGWDDAPEELKEYLARLSA